MLNYIETTSSEDADGNLRGAQTSEARSRAAQRAQRKAVQQLL